MKLIFLMYLINGIFLINLIYLIYLIYCILGGPVFQKVFQKLAPDILIKYLGYITNIPEVTMDFEHV